MGTDPAGGAMNCGTDMAAVPFSKFLRVIFTTTASLPALRATGAMWRFYIE
jgi:hypothetical protein